LSEPIIRLRDVEFAYGTPGSFTLAVPRLDIARGARAACIGPSGSGKTTLINLMTGIVAARTGTVELAGVSIGGLSDARRRAERIRRVGMVFQEFALLDYLTALENILLPYHVSPALRLTAEVEARARRLAAALGLAECRGRRPPRLSQGERQRVAIGRALITGPEVLVCDEPTGNLDPAMTGAALDLLFAQADEHEATLLVVTHDHSLLDRFDQILDMTALARERGAEA